MKTKIFISALAGILFSLTFAAPLAPTEPSHQADAQELPFANDATPVAKELAPTPVGTSIVKRASANDPALHKPFYIAAAPVDTPVAKRAAGNDPILNQPFRIATPLAHTPVAKRAANDNPTNQPLRITALTDTPIVRRAVEDGNNLPQDNSDIGMHDSGLYAIYWTESTDDAREPVHVTKRDAIPPVASVDAENGGEMVAGRDSKRGDALLPFAYAYEQNAAGMANPPISRRDSGLMPLDFANEEASKEMTNSHIAKRDDALSPSGFYAIYWTEVTDKAHNDAPVVKRAAASSDAATAEIPVPRAPPVAN
ncbi:uncharacterized protein Z519_07915 [Cladophialophora bantiana CBS 173.52]|uniref:Uncharacterized protein n=1 Tax=Cladophialophora bantiana (strain ATCC 10958 / CBS 173.52 / CDC B-1940 / NIH 8579) TaxID=1442370 RepID=A0A0D2EM30_CLAB1|nr:uncharacterized protein Z519_07915 [Cladophialophora bantiana CBS 173.52]KIW91021.1 hypothetical protein Z519_07915 [Cladophialophora bantiana CBS 173.52]